MHNIFISFKINRTFLVIFIIITTVSSVFSSIVFKKFHQPIEQEINIETTGSAQAKKDFIKWVDFNVTASAMQKAMKLDIESFGKPVHLNWIDMLSVLAVKYGGDFSRYREEDLSNLAKKLNNGEKIEDLTKDMKYYPYYKEIYTAILGEYLGEYSIQSESEDEGKPLIWTQKYGLKVFSPIAKGYGYSHYDDFGASRSYGYKRKHLGHDMMGNIGTPIIAIESGIIEALGWNQYGGWRIGIRSLDKKRYYYYAHLRKNHPYPIDLAPGQFVKAGDVIGYLGMTGYSSKENVNNIDTPHLHMGIQLIFDESQKEGNNEIWIDCYEIAQFLEKNRSAVVKDELMSEYRRKYDFFENLAENME